MDAVPVRVALHALDRRVDDVAPGAAADVLGIRREVPDAERREGEHRGVHRARRAEHDAARPGQETLCELEPRVPLADDEDALALIALGCVRRDVVRRRFEPGNRSDPRLGHADRKDADPAAVLAVRRLEHEARIVAPRRQPLAAVANANVPARRELDERRLHLGAGRNVERAIHELRCERLMLTLVADEAVVVVPLVLARAALERRVRLRPADEALIDREAPKHAARRRVARDHRAPGNPRAGEAVRGLQSAGPASHQHDVVVARRERTLV